MEDQPIRKDDLDTFSKLLRMHIGTQPEARWDAWLTIARFELRDQLLELAEQAVEKHMNTVIEKSRVQEIGDRHYSYVPRAFPRGYNVELRWTRFEFPIGPYRKGRKPSITPFHGRPSVTTGKIPLKNFVGAADWEKELIAECEDAFSLVRQCKRHLTAINRASLGLGEWLGYPSIQLPPQRFMRKRD